jgi:DeoR/GlpR family transcriptional regulator of sugar metabolism
MSLNSSETILVADSSKFGIRALCYCFDLTRVGKLVTDKGISKAALEEMKQRGVEVFVA